MSATSGQNYGLIIYEYDGKRDQSTSNSEEEVLSILFKLSGQEVHSQPEPEFPGYPLVADASSWAFLFYLIFPAAIILGAWVSRRTIIF